MFNLELLLSLLILPLFIGLAIESNNADAVAGFVVKRKLSTLNYDNIKLFTPRAI